MFGPRQQRTSRAMVVSCAVHAALVAGLLVIARQQPDSVTHASPSILPDHLVYLEAVGPGGGGGGGGDVVPLPASQMRASGPDAPPIPESPPAPSLTSAEAAPPPMLDRLPLAAGGAMAMPVVGALNGIGAAPARGLGTGTGADGGVGPGSGAGTGPGLGDGTGGGTGGGVYDVGNGVTSPERIREVKPVYTPDAVKAKLQGVVWVAATVLADGRVANPQVVKSLDRQFGLDQEAVRAVLATPFRPGRKDGKPVAVRVTFEIVFALR